MQPVCVYNIPLCPPWNMEGNSTPQRPKFYGSKWVRKQDVSHFERWITAQQSDASYPQAMPDQATGWLTRSVSKPGSPSYCWVGLGTFAITTRPMEVYSKHLTQKHKTLTHRPQVTHTLIIQSDCQSAVGLYTTRLDLRISLRFTVLL